MTPPATAHSEYLPTAPQFDIGDDWEVYSERIQHFFRAHPGVSDERKAAILLTAFSADAYKTIKNAIYPGKPESKQFQELITVGDSQFKPLRSSFAERGRFYEAKQEEGESITDWANRVKSLAMSCEFDEHLANSLRDKFVCGLRKGPVLERVYELRIKSTWDECVEAALKREMTMKEKSVMSEFFKLRPTKPHFSNAPKKNNSTSSGARSK